MLPPFVCSIVVVAEQNFAIPTIVAVRATLLPLH
jgi:hypothetical protein